MGDGGGGSAAAACADLRNGRGTGLPRLRLSDRGSGAQALHEQRFDHLLLDVNLPGRSGPDFATDAVRTQPWLRLVFVSGEGGIESNLPARSLPKPFSFDQLADILQG